MCCTQSRTPLTPQFHKDLAWFDVFLLATNGLFLLHKEMHTPLQVYVDACPSGAGWVLWPQSYHIWFPTHVLTANPSICHLEALNSVVAHTIWADRLRGKLVRLFSDSNTAVMVFQSDRERDEFLQSYASNSGSFAPSIGAYSWSVSPGVGRCPLQVASGFRTRSHSL